MSCGDILKYTEDVLQEAVNNSNSILGVLRFLGLKEAGGSCTHIKSRLKKFGISTEHFLGQSSTKGVPSTLKKSADEYLILRNSGTRQKSYILRRCLIEIGIEYECSLCGLPPVWNGYPITLEVDHINENWLDDRKENLRFLCPNCHSQLTRKQR